jgi:hypothetical protein
MRTTVWIDGTDDRDHVSSAHLVGLSDESAAIVTRALPVGGETIRLAVTVDRAVVAERMEWGGHDPVLDIGALEALWELPRGFPVPVEELPLWLVKTLGLLPPWALDQGEAAVTRNFEPCVSLVSVVSAPSLTVDEAIESLVWFTPWVRCTWAASDEHEALSGSQPAADHGLEIAVEGQQLGLAGGLGVPTPLRWQLEELAWKELRP